VYLVRHASAGLRDDTDPADVARRLDDVGRRQAEALIAHFAAAAVSWIAASPAVRCVETVEPLAASHACDVDRVDALLEGADITQSWRLVEHAAGLGGDSVLCSHGDVIPELIRRAQGRGMSVPSKSGCAKGSIWALEWDGTAFVSGTYTRLDG